MALACDIRIACKTFTLKLQRHIIKKGCTYCICMFQNTVHIGFFSFVSVASSAKMGLVETKLAIIPGAGEVEFLLY